MTRIFTRIFAIFAFCLILPTGSFAQSAGKSILVLDASGSMWGQIDGEAKITIAQRVIGDLLSTLPADQELGLTAYGHREKGNCRDIESLVAPGPNTRQAILDAVNAISPKGKTPLSAAVIAAAEQLRYEEDRATVILVSDGLETCNLDPCAVGRELEATGVDFTAHVIGFDVTDPVALAQLQCLADNTGGRFMTAANANELSEALEEVSAVVEPEPVALEMTLNAREGDNGPLISDGLVWTLTDSETGAPIVQNALTAAITETLDEGSYLVEVLRTEDEATTELRFAVAEGAPQSYTLQLPVLLPAATLDAPDTAVAGSTIQIGWSGPNEENDYLSVAEPGTPNNKYVNYTYSREGSPLDLLMPPVPGQYEIRYILNSKKAKLASHMITVTDVSADLTAPAEAMAGESLAVTWTGPDYQNDYISVAEIGSEGQRYANYTYTREGSPLELLMPSEPGTYELRYVMNQGKTVLARQSITVNAVGATLVAPDSAVAGAPFTVEWTGPDYQNDYISVAEIGSGGQRYVNYTYTREGSPLQLLMPAEPGTYEVRYVQNQDKTILARETITLEAVSASITAPATASAGQSLVVEWQGPDYQNDYISVAETGSEGQRYVNYTYTREGSPLQLEMPAEPGSYEIRYVQNQDKTILASQTITLEPVSASLSIPANAVAGSKIVVSWEGPDYQNDYISIASPEMQGNKYLEYSYARDGSPLQLQMPGAPGDYEVRYIQNQDHVILATAPITVDPALATLTTPPTGTAGARITVEWSGPDNQGDYISVALVGAPDNKYEHYEYTRSGNPLLLDLPEAPGAYEIRYVMKQDNTVLAREGITVGE